MFDFTKDERVDVGYQIALDRQEQDVTREQIVEELVNAIYSVLEDNFYRDEVRRALVEINEYLETA